MPLQTEFDEITDYLMHDLEQSIYFTSNDLSVNFISLQISEPQPEVWGPGRAPHSDQNKLKTFTFPTTRGKAVPLATVNKMMITQQYS